MADENLEQKVNVNAPKEEKAEEKKPVSITKSALEEIVDAAGKAANLGIVVGLPTVADFGIGKFEGMGGFDARATSTAFYLGAPDKSLKSARNESIIGTAFAAFAKYTLSLIYALGAYVSAPLIPLWQIVANAVYMTTDNIVKKKSLYIENFKKRLTHISKKAIKYLSIPTYLTQFLPGILQIPSIALQSYIFKKYIIGEKKEKTKQKDKTPYHVAASNVINKTYGRITSAAYDLGSLVRNFFKAPAPTPAPTQPALAPQPA